MTPVRRTASLIALAILLAGCSSASDDSAGTTSSSSTSSTAGQGSGEVRLVAVASGFDQPLWALPNLGLPGGLLVVEQEGRVWQVADNGSVWPIPWLDITDRVGSDGSEQGLLGLAFVPPYDQTRAIVVSYTDLNGDTVLSRIQHPNDAPQMDEGSEEILLQVDQPFSNHNGGHILFGPDGYLYVGLGDGGSANDPSGHGQNRATLLGSMLRIDVGADGPYTVPADNPFVGEAGTAPETWSYGWRNPWRFHFDPLTGDLWVGDVGQDLYEELDHEPAGAGGRNYGWNLFEGNHHSPGLAPVLAPVPGFTFPVAEYPHDLGCSITGGPTYRGNSIPSLQGATLYADYCSGTIWRIDGPTGTPQVLLESGLMVSSFGVDAQGEILVLDHNGGRLWRIEQTGSAD